MRVGDAFRFLCVGLILLAALYILFSLGLGYGADAEVKPPPTCSEVDTRPFVWRCEYAEAICFRSTNGISCLPKVVP